MADIEQHLLSEGYTMYIDGWGNYFYNNNLYKAAQQMDKSGDMHFILGTTYEIESWMDINTALDKALAAKKYASTRVKPNWIKLFSWTARTNAAVSARANMLTSSSLPKTC